MKRMFAVILILALEVAGCEQRNPQASKAPAAVSTAQSSEPVATRPVRYHLRPLGTSGSDWRIIGAKGTRPSRQFEMIDFKSLVVSGDNRQIWRANVDESSRGISYKLFLDEYNCKNKTSLSKKIAYTNGKDDILNTIDFDEKPEVVIPGTAGHSYLQYACGTLIAKNNIPHGVDPILYINDEIRTIYKRDVSNILDELMTRKVNTLLASESTPVYESFDRIASHEKGKKAIDTPLERYALGHQIEKNIKNKSLQQELIERLGAYE